MKRLVILAGLALAGCGAREELKPAADMTPPVAPYGATATPTAGDLLSPPIQTRPSRSDDVTKNTEKRRSDKFDLPPR